MLLKVIKLCKVQFIVGPHLWVPLEHIHPYDYVLYMHKIMQEDSWLIGSLVATFPGKNCPEKCKTIHAEGSV